VWIVATGAENGLDYVDAVNDSARAASRKALEPTAQAMLEAVRGSSNYLEAREKLMAAYRNLEPPRELATVTEAALILSQAAGHLAVNQDIPELPEVETE